MMAYGQNRNRYDIDIDKLSIDEEKINKNVIFVEKYHGHKIGLVSN